MKRAALPLFARAYHYALPHELIARSPAHPREAARLLVYARKARTIIHDTFRNLGAYLPEKSLIVFNDTKVVPARLTGYKPTGGKVEIFFLTKDSTAIRAFVSPSLPVGGKAYLSKKLFFEITHHDEKLFTLKPNFPMGRLDAILQKYGSTPLPPYIKNSPLTENQARREYQTVFAKIKGSVAAPTASLHFTKKLLDLLKKQGHQIAFVTLHVNLGTFAPLTKEHIVKNKLHEEWFYVPGKTRAMVMKAKKENRPIIACGTTVVRTLESEFRNQKGESQREPKWRQTDLFIRPGYKFKIIDGLITNFHLPGSSLLMLVAAFMGKAELKRAYREAIEKRYRFYSFGDGMLIL